MKPGILKAFKFKKNAFTLILISMGICNLNAQEYYEINLAEHDKDGTTKITVGKNNYAGIVILNRFPDSTYSVSILKKNLVMSPINYDGKANNVNTRINADDCTKGLKTALGELAKAKSEKEIPGIIKNLIKVDTSACKDSSKMEIIKFIQSTSQHFTHPFSVDENETVEIIISRKGAKQTYILEGRSSGEWISHFSFVVTPKRFNPKTYHLGKINSSDTVLTLLEDSKRPFTDLDFIPSVNFSYLLYKYKSFQVGPTAGLGLDNSNLSFLGGISMLYKTNIGFSTGVNFSRQYKLKEEYSTRIGDTFTETLSVDQLHDHVYRPNVYVSILIRLNNNPLASTNNK